MTLYEIDSAIMALTDPETGELMDYEAFENLSMEWNRKIEGIALWVKDLAAEGEAIATEIKTLEARKKAADSRVDRLKTYLDAALDGVKFSTPRCAITFRKTTSIQVDKPDELILWAEQNGYDNCVRHKEPEVSKSGVAALLKSGVPVPFARLNEGRSVGVK